MWNAQQIVSAALVLTVALAAASTATLASIEKEPVKVTYQNSGPRYDIDEVERTRLSPDANEINSNGPSNYNGDATTANNNNNNADSNNNNADNNRDALTSHISPIGHVSVRRIFLVPMMPPPEAPSRASGRGDSIWSSHSQPESVPEHPASLFGGWPYFSRPRHDHREHDDTSVSSTRDRPMRTDEAERESEPGEHPRQPMFDPIQMMVDLMHQALNSGIMSSPSSPSSPSSSSSGGLSALFSDLNKEASGSPTNGEQPDESSRRQAPDADKPMRAAHNETKEEVVEIEGKKYLRKIIINKHIGENLVFVTKRLLFIPLNETEAANADATPAPATTELPTTTVGAKVADVVPTDSARKPIEDATTTSTTTTTTESQPSSTTPESVTTTTAVTSAPVEATTSESTTQSSPVADSTTTPSAATAAEETTPKESWGTNFAERVSETLDKVAERVVAEATTTAKP